MGDAPFSEGELRALNAQLPRPRLKHAQSHSDVRAAVRPFGVCCGVQP